MCDRGTVSVKGHRTTALAHMRILLLTEKLNIMHFLTRSISEISLYLQHNLECTFFAGFTICGVFPTNRRSSLLKENCTHSVCWRFTAFLAPPGQRAIGKEFKMCGWSGGKKKRKKPTQTKPKKRTHTRTAKAMCLLHQLLKKNSKNIKVINHTFVGLSGGLPVLEECTNAELTTWSQLQS